MSYKRHKPGDRLQLWVDQDIKGTVVKSTPELVTIKRDDAGEYTPKKLTGYHWEFNEIGELL